MLFRLSNLFISVALNFQTEGTMMDLYLGKFRQNGSSGYILKPEYMRKGLLANLIIILILKRISTIYGNRTSV